MFDLQIEDLSQWAHVIIDVQKRFASAAEQGEEAEEVARNIATVKEALNKLKVATYVVYFKQFNFDHTKSKGGLYAIKLNDGDVIVPKTGDSMIKGSDIATLLRAAGHSSLLISGFNRGYCVRESVTDSVREDFNVFVMRDCIGHMKHQEQKYSHKHAYDQMREAGAVITSSQDVIGRFSSTPSGQSTSLSCG
ncbi:MAG: isochorismatase family protein [Pseudomonadota bacterium]